MMRYVSTRGGLAPVTISRAVAQGLAPDGGLIVPETLPTLDPERLARIEDLPALAAAALEPFFQNDPLADQLEDMCRTAFSFPLPITELEPGAQVLELFHGPTAAFKDFGARFLAECLCRLNVMDDQATLAESGDTSGEQGTEPFTILVATSGDTGGAVGAAFDGRPEARVVIVFPQGRVSPLQEHQLTCWGENVLSLAVSPDFDACQSLAKQAFADPALTQRFKLTSANSINIARLLAQTVYYAALAGAARRQGHKGLTVYVPTGNGGNGLAAVWAGAMGLPIDEVVFATNANAAMADYVQGRPLEPQPSVATIANAMDVGRPSNAERLVHLRANHRGPLPRLSGGSVSDARIRARIRADYDHWNVTWCPHSATAAELWACRRPLGGSQGDASLATIVATAHPAKFTEVVSPIIDGPVALPPALDALAQRPSRMTPIDADLGALGQAMAAAFAA